MADVLNTPNWLATPFVERSYDEFALTRLRSHARISGHDASYFAEKRDASIAAANGFSERGNGWLAELERDYAIQYEIQRREVARISGQMPALNRHGYLVKMASFYRDRAVWLEAAAADLLQKGVETAPND